MPDRGAIVMANYQAVPPPATNDPGNTLGLVGMILAIIPCTALIGLILSVVAFFMSRRVGVQNQKAVIGIIIGALWLILSLVAQFAGWTAGLYNR
jgi:membrane associated rhomboid family serine protease